MSSWTPWKYLTGQTRSLINPCQGDPPGQLKRKGHPYIGRLQLTSSPACLINGHRAALFEKMVEVTVTQTLLVG